MKYTAEQKAELKKKDIDRFQKYNRPKPPQYFKDGYLIIQSKL